MTIHQLKFLDTLMFVKTKSGRTLKAQIKKHRQCWYMPAWMRDGFKSEIHYYHDRESVAGKFQAFNDPKHPNHDLAKAAADLKL